MCKTLELTDDFPVPVGPIILNGARSASGVMKRSQSSSRYHNIRAPLWCGGKLNMGAFAFGIIESVVNGHDRLANAAGYEAYI
jgi:hypothetical protein